MKQLLLLVFLIIPTLSESAPLSESSEVYPPGMNGVAQYRIPGIVVTNKGTVLAYAEARKNGSADWGEIEIHMRRSTDGGKTWQTSKHIAHHGQRLEGNPHKKKGREREQTVNNPVAIVDRNTGAIEFLYCVNYARCYSMRSTDDGVTWSEPVDITASFEPLRKYYDWKVIATGPGHGIQLKSGRLLVPVWIAYGKEGAHGPSAVSTLFSDDHGKTWEVGEIAVPNEGGFQSPNETMMTTLSNDNVMLVARSKSNKNRKIISTSPNGATDWTKPVFHDQLWEPVCMASIISHPSKPGILIFSNPHSLKRDRFGNELPAVWARRENLSVKLSEDDGKTWPVNKVLDAGSSAYSDLAVLPDSTVLCLYEKVNNIVCARFNLEWLKMPN
jgi:sialidase-1